MIKPDYAKLRADLIQEYREYPNPHSDGVVAFEAKAAEIIADFAILVMKEATNEVPDDILVQGVIGITAIVLHNIILNAPADHRVALAHMSMMILADNLSNDQSGQIEVADIDVGDA